MADRSPLLFTPRLGGLFPANAKAQAAMRETQGTVSVSITGGRPNQRRRGLYWAVAALVVEVLNDLHGMTLDEDDLHDITRQKLKLGHWIELPSGDRRFKPASTSNRAMGEAERAEYTDRAFRLWSTWTGVDAETLRREAEIAA